MRMIVAGVPAAINRKMFEAGRRYSPGAALIEREP